VAEIMNFGSIPSQPGMGLEDEDIARMRSWLDGRTLFSADVSSFDWCVKPWMFELDLEVRKRLMGVSSSHWLAQLMDNRLRTLMRSLFVTSSGELYAQRFDGLQKSGDYNTSSTNSRIMAALLRLSGATWCKTMGDDSVSADTDVQILRKLCNVKSFTGSESELEFCSHRITLDGADYLNWPKTAFRFMSTYPVSEMQSEAEIQFDHVMRFNPRERAEVIKALSVRDWDDSNDRPGYR
jgi:hypothetical protein